MNLGENLKPKRKKQKLRALTLEVHGANLIPGIEDFLHRTKVLPINQEVVDILIGEESGGIYPLTIYTRKTTVEERRLK